MNTNLGIAFKILWIVYENAGDIELTMYLFVYWANFLIFRQTLCQKIRNTDDNILSQNKTQLTHTLLYDNILFSSRFNWGYYICVILFFLLLRYVN